MSEGVDKNKPNLKQLKADKPTLSNDEEAEQSNDSKFLSKLDIGLDVKNLPQVPKLSTEKRFNLSPDLPKPSSANLSTDPYSTRDMYTIFNDMTTDYFKHGLQVVNQVTPGTTIETPFENQDPVYFGFELVINNIYSPLFNGSIDVFLKNYSMVNEINARKGVYEDFKNQFQKIFKTRTPLKINQDLLTITRMTSVPPLAESNKQVFNFGKKAYLGYYLKGIKGLDKLVENNTPGAKKFITDYGKDLITLDFQGDDVSLSVGTLAYLYKLLYWSRPQGKGIVPENLLRFNCEIIISELRNLKRIRKAVSDGSVEIIKDNLSRYIYSLRECQFYFDKLPHDEAVDLTQTKTFDNYSITFDYKYSSCKLEKFVPTGSGFGVYAGYDMGAIWKIGNPGAREKKPAGNSTVTVYDENGQPTSMKTSTADSSVPRFFTVGRNEFNQNGIQETSQPAPGTTTTEPRTTKPKPFVIKRLNWNKPNSSSVSAKDKNKPDDKVEKSRQEESEERGQKMKELEKNSLSKAEALQKKNLQRLAVTKSNIKKKIWQTTQQERREIWKKFKVNLKENAEKKWEQQKQGFVNDAKFALDQAERRARELRDAANLALNVEIESLRQRLYQATLNLFLGRQDREIIRLYTNPTIKNKLPVIEGSLVKLYTNPTIPNRLPSGSGMKFNFSGPKTPGDIYRLDIEIPKGGNVAASPNWKELSKFPKYPPMNPIYRAPRNVYLESQGPISPAVKGQMIEFMGSSLAEMIGKK